MTTQRLWFNVYQAGYYHSQGKPLHTNLHGGDLFVSEQAAKEAAKVDHGYVTTLSCLMPIPDGAAVLENPANSEPTPFAVTRADPSEIRPYLKRATLYDAATQLRQWAVPMDSLEPSDDIGMSYEEWSAERARTGFAPAPQVHDAKVAAILRPAMQHLPNRAQMGVH